MSYCARPFRCQSDLYTDHLDNWGSMYNVTTTGYIVDFHTYRGQDVLSVNFGDTVKVWFIWPPTVHNLEQLEMLYNQGGIRRPV